MKLKWTSHSDLAINTTPSVGRERYLSHMTFQTNEHPMFIELFGPIIGLKEEWEAQGASESELDLSCFKYRFAGSTGVPVNTGRLGGFPEETIEETDECHIYRDSLGRTMKLVKGFATLALPLDFPVKTMEDWLRIKPMYEFSEERFPSGWQDAFRRATESDSPVQMSIPGGFDEPRQLMGEEGICIAYYEQPELIHDILDTIGNTARKVSERVTAAGQVDILCVHEDMAGKSGSLAGPRQIDEFIAPYYRKVWDLLSERGAVLFCQDSDGDMNGVIPSFLAAGVNSMYPMEPAANMDIVKSREQYGTSLAFRGGLDKHVIRRSMEEIEAELEYKIPPMIASGGCVLGLDHRIPNGTPLENYRFYIKKAWEIMSREVQNL